MRTSVYRNKILQALKNAHLLSIADINKSIPEADFSTIFRNLELLCRKGLVKRVSIDKDLVLYELINTDHPHDHFFCINCGLIESLELHREILKKMPRAEILDILVRGTCEQCKR